MQDTDRKRLPPFIRPDLIERATIVDYERNQRLFSIGEPVRQLFYVLEGQVKAVRTDPFGTECVMLRGESGEFFAESSLVTDRYVCDGSAIKPSRLALFPVEDVRRALDEGGPFATALFGRIASQARKQCSRQERLRLKKARDRVVHYLACEVPPDGELTLKVPMSEWACELALEPETLYRTLADLETEGALARNRRTMRLTGSITHQP